MKNFNLTIRQHWGIFSAVLLTFGLFWIAITASVYPSTPITNTAPKSGFQAPEFSLTALDGQAYSTQQLQGKVAVINIWTTWCTFCSVEMPALQSAYQSFSHQDVEFYAVNSTSQDTLSAVQEFANRLGLTFPILLDDSGRVTRLYQVQALPTTFILDRRGIIRSVIIGGPLTEALLQSQISALINEVR